MSLAMGDLCIGCQHDKKTRNELELTVRDFVIVPFSLEDS